MCNFGISKKLIHLFQSAALGFGVEKDIAYPRDEIENKEEIEVVESHVPQRNWTALSEKEIQTLLAISSSLQNVMVTLRLTQLVRAAREVPRARISVGKISAG